MEAELILTVVPAAALLGAAAWLLRRHVFVSAVFWLAAFSVPALVLALPWLAGLVAIPVAFLLADGLERRQRRIDTN